MHKIKQIAFTNASFIEADSRNFEIVIELLVRAESDIVSMFYTVVHRIWSPTFLIIFWTSGVFSVPQLMFLDRIEYISLFQIIMCPEDEEQCVFKQEFIFSAKNKD